MSENQILARFSKSGDLHHLSRRYHGLTREQKQRMVELIQNGVDVSKAIAAARKTKCA